MIKKFSLIFSLLFILFSVIQFNGCADDTVAPPDDNDPNVFIYKNVNMYFSDTINDESHHAVNLYTGIVRKGNFTDKDMELIDLNSTYANYYFRTGSATIDRGYETRFGRVSNNASQTDWDTISMVQTPTLDSLYFTEDNTAPFGYLEPGGLALKHPIYAFYLKGKFAEGVTPNRVYGLIYLKDFVYLDTIRVKVTIDIKLNKAGLNDFKP
jgi:hypothetical protein